MITEWNLKEKSSIVKILWETAGADKTLHEKEAKYLLAVQHSFNMSGGEILKSNIMSHQEAMENLSNMDSIKKMQAIEMIQNLITSDGSVHENRIKIMAEALLHIMKSTNELNSSSIKIIRDLHNNIQNHQFYKNYNVILDENNSGFSSINLINKDTRMSVNIFKFYASESDGNIKSIRIYGAELQNHYKNINNSKNIFGFKVTNIKMVTDEASSPFVDVYL